jgi:hypothetical protein
MSWHQSGQPVNYEECRTVGEVSDLNDFNPRKNSVFRRGVVDVFVVECLAAYVGGFGAASRVLRLSEP